MGQRAMSARGSQRRSPQPDLPAISAAGVAPAPRPESVSPAQCGCNSVSEASELDLAILFSCSGGGDSPSVAWCRAEQLLGGHWLAQGEMSREPPTLGSSSAISY